MQTRSLKIILRASIAAAMTASIWAQSYQGGLRGIVVDSAGGSVASAKVSLVDEATSQNRATITNASGEYVFSSVDPASYAVIVESPGFKKFDRKGIKLATQQRHSHPRRPTRLVIFPAPSLTGDLG